MSLRDTNTMYGMVSRLNHWIGALFVLLLLGIGLLFEVLPRGELLRYFKRLHIAIGTIGIAFLVFRVYWRLHTASPLPLPQAPALQRMASFVHRALLVGIVILVVTGPLSIWSIGRPFGVFETLQIPSPFPPFKSWHEPLEEIHGWTAYAMIALIALHVGGVLKHQFIDRDGLLARMTGRVAK